MDAELRRIRNRAFIFGVILIFIVTCIVRNRSDEDEMEYFLRQNTTISKVELAIYSGGENKVIISDRSLLDTINASFRSMKEIHIQHGGISDTVAYMNIYKNVKRIDLRIIHSPYYGWAIFVGNRTFKSDYIFRLIKFYSR